MDNKTQLLYRSTSMDLIPTSNLTCRRMCPAVVKRACPDSESGWSFWSSGWAMPTQPLANSCLSRASFPDRNFSAATE